MDRYICIHCHFYQPPRENPWLEAIELQDSAYPFHDWNERITAECYAPNSASRILDPANRILQIVNNYRHISFNFGPTLLSWMEHNAPDVYEKVLEADHESRAQFSGHGSALAQPYNHMILPLATRRDKQTQVLWGIRDFQQRFGREPEGMWLPETAVDLETLEVLAELGIKYTVLAPHQARQVRKLRRTSVWRNVEGANIDPTQAYVCRLPSGRAISLFFYDGPISRAVAFEGLLSSGESFARRLLGGFNDSRKWPQLMHIATDGETYGHHHRHGDMALAYALHYIESNHLARITNYGEYLAKHPPKVEAEIIDNTSWSCAHGVERWRSSCGCNSGGRAGWTQLWRAPLRQALDWLRDDLTPRFEQKARELLKDPWAARDAYIRVVLDRSRESLWRFFEVHALRPLSDAETMTALKLLEMQRHLMLMYTSCGWFFDELSGIETVQVIFYAGRALQLAEMLFGDHTERSFLDRLALAQSNLPEHGDGESIYVRWIKPAIVNLLDVGAHYAISSMFHDYAPQDSIYCYDVERDDYHVDESGRARIATGRARIRSQITRDAAEISFGALHLGDHNLNAGVRYFQGEQPYREMRYAVAEPFSRADLPSTLRAIDRHFPQGGFSIKSLFRDEQRRVLDRIMATVVSDAEASYRGMYEAHAPLLRFLNEVNMPLPRVLRMTAEFVLTSSLRRELAAEDFDLGRVQALLDSARRERVALDSEGLSYALRNRLGAMMEQLAGDPHSPEKLETMERTISLVRSLPFEVDLWKVQNIYYDLLQRVYPEVSAAADEPSLAWTARFAALGELLGISVQPATVQVPVAA
jgi:alpha-amylase/alpha-mannosidase (GH57 family)